MTQHTPDVPLGSWLADLPDEALIRLLELRPDLAQPPPGSLAALAARAEARQSVKAATDDIDFLRLGLLDALVTLEADAAPVPVSAVTALLGDRVTRQEIDDALGDLRDRALVWGSSAIQITPHAAVGLPWHPGQVTYEDTPVSPREITDLLAGLETVEREVLNKLSEGSPMGRTRDAAPGAPSERPVPRLLELGLLRRVDDETVILPRQVGQVLRGEVPGPTRLSPPDPVVTALSLGDVDAAAAGAVIDLLRDLELLLETLGNAPVVELRSGGLGIREVKRLAKALGVDEPRLGLLLELAAAAGLIASGTPEPMPAHSDGSFWAPTMAADRFTALSTAERWHVLAQAWLDLPGRPSLIGGRGPDGKQYGALTDALFSTAAPLDRRLLLELLTDLPDGAAVDAATASAALIWKRPRWARRLQPQPIADLLAESQVVGLVGRGAISTPGRSVLAGTADPSTAAASIAAMTHALPKPVDYFLVQADLTVVVPGPLERELAEQLAAVATIESAGTAMVYRVSEQSIRHALDIGKTRDWIQTLFAERSRTPVPQGLTYLIDDVARRHGQLRIGMAASFVRCEDPVLLAQAVAAPALDILSVRALAPTVAVSPAPISDLLSALRAAGFAPAVEDSTGAIVELKLRLSRVATAPHRRPYAPAPRPSADTLKAVVSVLRTVTTAPFGGSRMDPTVAKSILQRAAHAEETVVIGYVDAAGVATQRVVSPIAVRGSQLVAFDSGSARMREFAVHRITSIDNADG